MTLGRLTEVKSRSVKTLDLEYIIIAGDVIYSKYSITQHFPQENSSMIRHEEMVWN